MLAARNIDGHFNSHIANFDSRIDGGAVADATGAQSSVFAIGIKAATAVPTL